MKTKLAPLIAASLLSCSVCFSGTEVINIGSDRQLFVDKNLIEDFDGVEFRLNRPERKGPAIQIEHDYERGGVSFGTVFEDSGIYKMIYRAHSGKQAYQGGGEVFAAYAESKDGIHWEKPNLGLIEFQGSKENNLIWKSPGINLSVMMDPRPGVDPNERYKGIVRVRKDQNPEFFTDYDKRVQDLLFTVVSPDCKQWSFKSTNPIFNDPPFDTFSRVFWDTNLEQYVIYTRGIKFDGRVGLGVVPDFNYGSDRGDEELGVRWVRRATSTDFVNWTELEPINVDNPILEQFYTNAVIQYPNSPKYYFMFPSRFANARMPIPDWEFGSGVNDIVFLSSRNGINFNRSFMEAYIRPGKNPNNWHERALYVGIGILRTSEHQYSQYGMEEWRLNSNNIQRFEIRVDGFVSVVAPYEGGELSTKAFKFTGDELAVNLSTSAVGKVLIQIEDEWGNPIEGYTFSEADSLYGDEINMIATWGGSSDLVQLKNRIVRLSFQLFDADLYAFQFRQSSNQ